MEAPLKLTEISLEASLRLTEYFDKCRAQLLKDVNDEYLAEQLFSLERDCLESLEEACRNYFRVLFERNPERFMSVIYQIDIPEKLLNKVLFSDGADWDSVIALILKRELLKVLLRERYT